MARLVFANGAIIVIPTETNAMDAAEYSWTAPQIIVKRSVTIGRNDSKSADKNRINLNVPNTISREHVLLITRDDGWHVQNINSTNQTNIKRGEKWISAATESDVLQDGDEIVPGTML